GGIIEVDAELLDAGSEESYASRVYLVMLVRWHAREPVHTNRRLARTIAETGRRDVIRKSGGRSGLDWCNRRKWNQTDRAVDTQALWIEWNNAERVGAVYRRDQNHVRIDICLIAQVL